MKLALIDMHKIGKCAGRGVEGECIEALLDHLNAKTITPQEGFDNFSDEEELEYLKVCALDALKAYREKKQQMQQGK